MHYPVLKRTSTLHDFPYVGRKRKCFHPWIINVTPPGRAHCLHNCSFCYARDAVYSDPGETPKVYANLPELVECDLQRLHLAPPVLLSTTTDPCQPSAALCEQTRRIVETLIRWGVSFAVTTKGDPTFLATLPGFHEHEHKAIAVSIEGPPEVLSLLSPQAPPFEARMNVVRQMKGMGVWVGIRLDPYILPVYQQLYGYYWFERTERLLDEFAAAGARHVTGSTGRLDKRRVPGQGQASFGRILSLLRSRLSPEAAETMTRLYVYGSSGTCHGYVLREDVRRELHLRLRAACEARGMTYASCQELPEEFDSPGLATCEGFRLPFCRKGPDGRFHPIEGCGANCHLSCVGLTNPPCGQPALAARRPYRAGLLR